MKSIISFVLGIIVGVLLIGILFFKCENKHSDVDVYYRTTGGEFEFTVNRLKGSDFEEMLIEFEDFKNENPNNSGLVLERVTQRNYLKICRWCQYHEMPEWNYPRG